MSKSKRNKQAKPANPGRVAAKLIEVGEVRKSEGLSPVAREKAAKAEKALAHEYAMTHSPGYANAVARREAEATREA